MFGGHVFADDVELGASSMNAPGPESAGLFGARIGVRIIPALAAELEAIAIPTHDDVAGTYAGVAGLRAHARVDLVDLVRGMSLGGLRPFAIAGVGVHIVDGSQQLRDDTDVCYQWGVGVGYALNERFALRFDLRHLIVPDRTEDGATNEVEMSAGVTIRFGSPSAPPRLPTIAPRPAPAIAELTGIQFEVKRAEVAASSWPILDRAAEILRTRPHVRVEIAGHTSSEGSEAENQELARARAMAVKRYLVERGIADERLVIATHGSSRPIADNHTEEGRARNRRIEFRILDVPAEAR